jgi:two-component system, LytTR family, response regulator
MNGMSENKNMHCVIIEDEPLAGEKLAGFIRQVPFLVLDLAFDNAVDALHYLKVHQTDLIFVDIQMEKLTGIQMLEILSPKSYVVITTAYPDYALKGFELHVTDYLLKPFSLDRFLSSVHRIHEDFCSKTELQPEHPRANIFVKSEYRLENILIQDILFIESLQNYLRIHLPNRKIMTKLSLRSILEQLPASAFIQVHKSFVVQLSKIQTIENNRIRIMDAYIPIGDAFRSSFYERTKP